MRPSHRTGRTPLTIMVMIALAAALLIPAGRAAATPSNQPVRSCASLAELTFTDGTRVTAAEKTSTSPPICHVTLIVPEAINIALSLPVDTWNGRFQGVGGGGWAGVLTFPDNAARAGYAGAFTDTGHSSRGGEWAWSPTGMKQNLINDFGYRAVHEMTVKGKAVTRAYYGRAPAYSYWNGCSTGGRQGLMEAQRFPHDYDGILSAAPAINWDRFLPASLWPQTVMREAGNVIAPCKFAAYTQAVIDACDDVDGVADGIVDPHVCRFDPRKLIGLQTDCGTITNKDAAVINKIWQGPRRPNGSFLWYGLTPGTDFAGLAATTPDLQQLPFPIPVDWFRWWLAKDPAFDWRTVTTANFARYFDQSRAEYNDVLGTDNPNLRPFRDSGGKLIIWHGWADQLIFPHGAIDYFNRVVARMGGRHLTERFARLFMAPGVAHCAGGPGAAPADPISALVAWVERGRAPDTLKGVNGDLTRPLCRWPKVPRYKGHDNTNDAANFRCANKY